MRPAQRLGDRPRRAVGGVELAEAGIGVGLQDAGQPARCRSGCSPRAVARVEEQRRRRRAAGERPVVADIGPEPAGDGLALGQHRHRRVVAVQPLGGEHMRLDQLVQRRQRGGAGADLIGQRREAELDALAGVALALPVERLVLAELLEQDHRQQARRRPSRAAMTWKGAGGWVIFSQSRQVNFSRTVWITFHCRGITSSVSVTSSPSLASRCRPQQRAGRRRRRPPPARAADAPGNGFRAGVGGARRRRTGRRLRRRLLGGELVLGGGGLQLLELQLQLVEQPRAALGALAVQLAPAAWRSPASGARSPPRRPTPSPAPRGAGLGRRRAAPRRPNGRSRRRLRIVTGDASRHGTKLSPLRPEA